MSKMTVERVWGVATVSGGGHVLKTTRGIVHMVPCSLPAASVSITMRSSMGGSVELHLSLDEVAELIDDLKAVAFDG
jgi:hypothetical protein